MRLNLFSASSNPVAVHRRDWSPSRQPFTLRATRSTVDRHDSIGLVEDSVRRSSSPTPKRCSVSVSPDDLLQLRLGLRVVAHRVGVAEAPVIILLAVLRQVILHIPPLVDLTPLHFGPFSEHLLD